MVNWIETIRHRLGSEFDGFLLHSARVFSLVRAGGEKIPPAILRSWIRYYLDQPYAEHPARFFSIPRRPPDSTILDERPFSDGTVRTYAFPSGYKVRNPAFREVYLGYRENRTAYLVHWAHGDRKRETIVCCHGWSLGDPRQAERMFRVHRLFELGLDVALFITPFHWRRASSLLERIHPPFPFRHPVLGLEGMGQAMYDLASSFLLLTERGASRIGIIGASLGGYLAALFVSLTRKAYLAALVLPLVDFNSLQVPLDPASSTGRASLGGQGLRDEIRALWRIHSPLSHPCKLPPERCLLIAAIGDRLCPFEDVKRLTEHWGGPQTLFLRGGHAMSFPRRERGRAWYRFLAEHGFI